MATSRSTSPDQPAKSPASPAARVDLTDAAARAEWLDAACAQAADVIAAALDATAPPGERMLGRKGAREQIEDAADALATLFTAVGLDLDRPPVAVRLRRASGGGSP
jgi:hypothetical protein